MFLLNVHVSGLKRNSNLSFSANFIIKCYLFTTSSSRPKNTAVSFFSSFLYIQNIYVINTVCVLCKELLSNLSKEVRPGYAVYMRRSFEIIYKLNMSIKLCKLYFIVLYFFVKYQYERQNIFRRCFHMVLKQVHSLTRTA